MGFDGYELFGKRGFGESIYRFRLFIPFLCNPIDWIAEPIQNYEMVVCGNGKLVYLRRKFELDDVLRIGFYDTEEEKRLSPEERTVTAYKFILLYMPQGSDELVELY